MVSPQPNNSFESSSAHDTAMPKTVEKSRHHIKSIAMKKYFLFLVFFSLITSLKSFSQEGDFVIAKNPDVTLTADDGTLIVAKDIYSSKAALKRSIQLFNPKTNQLTGEAFIRLEAAEGVDDMYHLIKENPDKFTGTLVIESGGVVIFRKEIVNGVAEPAVFVAERTTGQSGGPCTLGNIHNCVSHRIEGMSWWRFGLCLIRAPVCYAQQWAYCIIDVCINHVQYRNPN